jgi:hypothetical protein
LVTFKQEVDSLASPCVLDRVSVRQALWLMVRPRASLQEKERIDLDALCQPSSKRSALCTLVQDGWRSWCGNGKPLVCSLGNSRVPKAGSSNCSDVQQTGLERDQEAIRAGLSHSSSHGMTEGCVNTLKRIKRQSYARARFPLLRQRVLHALESCSLHAGETRTNKALPASSRHCPLILS